MTASPTSLLIRATQDPPHYYVFHINRRGNKQATALLKIFFTVKSCILDSLKPISESVYVTAYLC